MLKSLNIESFALINNQIIPFSEKLNVITGATGSGKSMILSAIDWVLGGNHPMQKESAHVTLEIDPLACPKLQTWLREQQLCTETLLIRRQIQANGRSNHWINGQFQ